MAQTAPAGLVLTGGEVATAVCEALAASQIWLGGEIAPGLAWGFFSDGDDAGLKVATKAGGFGGEDMLAAAMQHF
jgi:D-threonate/D-erythronate kinase